MTKRCNCGTFVKATQDECGRCFNRRVRKELEKAAVYSPADNVREALAYQQRTYVTDPRPAKHRARRKPWWKVFG